MQAHLAGRKHRRRVEVVNGKGMKMSPHYCSLCDITTTSAEHMIMHLNGKAHKRRVATGNVPSTAAGVDLKAMHATTLEIAATATDDSRPTSTPQQTHESTDPPPEAVASHTQIVPR